MRHKLLLALVLPFAVMSLVGCQTKKDERPRAGGGEGGDETEEITYEGWVKGFMATNCVSCHTADSEEGGPDLTTLAKVKAKQKAIITRMETSDTKKLMPPPKSKKTVTEAQIDKFKAWVQNDFAEGKKKGATPPPAATAKISYIGWVKGYEAKNCATGTGCHASGGIDPILSNYEESADAAEKSLKSIKGKRMPKGNAKGDEAVIAKYEAWIKAETPEEEEADTGTGTGTGTGEGTGTGTGDEEAKAAGWELIKKDDGTGCAGAKCHSAGAIGPDLSTEAKAIAAKADVLRTTKGGSMPKNNAYDAADKKVIQDWYDSL